MENIINIGIPSKGRLRKDVLGIFKKKKLKLISERGERDLIGSIKNKKNIKTLYLHAREIIERLADNSLDIGFSGFDLLKESENVSIVINSEDNSILSVDMPLNVTLEVTPTEPGVKGNTATNATKPVTLETGAIVNVPLFINEGDKVKIDTEKGQYLERIK